MGHTPKQLCKDCAHYHRTSTGRFDDRCQAPHQDRACEFERDPAQAGNSCGPQALHYVPRIASAASTTASASALTP